MCFVCNFLIEAVFFGNSLTIGEARRVRILHIPPWRQAWIRDLQGLKLFVKDIFHRFFNLCSILFGIGSWEICILIVLSWDCDNCFSIYDTGPVRVRVRVSAFRGAVYRQPQAEMETMAPRRGLMDDSSHLPNFPHMAWVDPLALPTIVIIPSLRARPECIFIALPLMTLKSPSASPIQILSQ